MIHLDIMKPGRQDRPGHRVTGTRTSDRSRGAGWGFAHVAVDDATRLAFAEVLADERKHTTTGFLLRALRWYGSHGIGVEREMTGNGSAYRSRRVGKSLRWLAIRHIFIGPYTPKTNGKAERFIQTLLREWAYGLGYSTSAAGNNDPPRWLDGFSRPRLQTQSSY